MDDYQNETLPVGEAQVAEAMQTLQRYRAGKAALDRRLVDNELWFRMGHWKNCQNPMMAGKAQPSSGWLFNSIANKHADAMDNYPEPNVLPRAADDEKTAQALSSVLPVVLEQADYEQVYSDCWWRKLKQGTGVTGIFWDPQMRGGMGDITVRSVNLLMLYWEPGVEDIQSSPDFFSLSLEDTAQLTAQYPQLKGRTAGGMDVPRYIHDEGQDTSTTGTTTARTKTAVWCCTTASSAMGWCCTPARMIRHWPNGGCMITGSTPLCLTRCL